MKDYCLSTWVGQQMVEVENLTAEDERYAIAYATGRLDERHTQHSGALTRIGVAYRLDKRVNDDGLIEVSNETRVGDWFFTSLGEGDSLMWVPHHPGGPP